MSEVEKEKNNLRLEEILQQIKEWLKDLKNGSVEEIEIKEYNGIALHVKFSSDDNIEKKMMEFQYFVTFFYNTDFFRITTYYYFNKDDTIGFKLLSKEDKIRFANMLKIPLLTMNLGYMWVPNLPDFESLEISRQIYFDGFSKHNFMSNVDSVMRGYEVILSIYDQFRNSFSKKYQ